MLRLNGTRERFGRFCALMLQGLDTAEIARRVGVSEAVIYRWWIAEKDRRGKASEVVT